MAFLSTNCRSGSKQCYKIGYCAYRKLCNIKLISLLLVSILLLHFLSTWYGLKLISWQDLKISVTSKIENEEHLKKNDMLDELKQLSRKLSSEDIKETYHEILEGADKNDRNVIFGNQHNPGRQEISEKSEKNVIYIDLFSNQNNVGLKSVEFLNDLKSSETNQHDQFNTKEGKKSLRLKKRLPQCIIIGMRKAGTRALINFLELNKNIKAAKKEVHFFDEDENYSKGLDWYREQMPYSYSDQITIEKTPRYVLEDKVPDRISKMNSSIRLILIVKEPVLRAISEYSQNYARGRIYRQLKFEEYAIKRETGEVNIEYKPINRSIYYQHMSKWFSKFSRKQIHIVDGDDLVTTPSRELNKIETFLGLKHEIKENMFYFNKTKGFHCVKRDQTSEPVCLGATKGRKHPDVLPGVVKTLHNFYRPWNEIFFKQIGKRFNWP